MVEVLYGFASSAEVAYYTYIYAKVRRDDFKKVTSYVHTAIIVGNLVAGLSAQILVSTQLLDIRQLNFITLGSCIVALILSFFLPSVQRSIYFHKDEPLEPLQVKSNGHAPTVTPVTQGHDVTPVTQAQDGVTSRFHCRNTFEVLWADFKRAYSNAHVLKWSIWWALAAAGNQMIRNYVQALYEAIADKTETTKYNAAIDVVHTFLSKINSLLVKPGHLHPFNSCRYNPCPWRWLHEDPLVKVR